IHAAAQAVEEFVLALSAVAAHLKPRDAAQAAAVITQAMAKATYPNNLAGLYTLSGLTRGLSAVATRLEPRRAARLRFQAAAILIPAMAKWDSTSLGQAMWAVLTRVEPSEASRRAGSVAAVLAPLAGTAQPLAAPALLGANLKPFPCPLSTPQLVELLKQPTCAGWARRLILDQLQNRYRQRLAEHWDFVRFAEKHNLGLDFTSPPKRLVLQAAGKEK
ncbi:MAG TPA: hypothetical protein VKE98_10515, partial [Gemmataceae bacterium]|nr:hypothetical protein [Gemmataceae bacterium]